MSYLIKQHNYGGNTISSYRDTFKLLLAFMAKNHTDVSKIVLRIFTLVNAAGFMSMAREINTAQSLCLVKQKRLSQNISGIFNSHRKLPCFAIGMVSA